MATRPSGVPGRVQAGPGRAPPAADDGRPGHAPRGGRLVADQSEADWLATIDQADAHLASGLFLIDRLGAERYLDPPLMAALLVLRRGLIDDHGATTAAELMLIDSAVLAFYHQLRINGWIGDLAAQVEFEFFRSDSPTAKLKAEYGAGAATIRGLKVEELVRRLAEQLMPLLDRSNRMLLRNLKALKALREAAGPSVSIGSVGQVNVAANQINAGGGGAEAGGATPARTRRSRARP
jgi:hypothetical protein